MDNNKVLKEQMLETVANQLKSNDPPETKETYDRLRKEGYSDMDSRLLIAQCVLYEIWAVMSTQKPFNEERYVENLKRLPQEPE